VALAGAIHGRVEGLVRDKTRKPGKPPLPSSTIMPPTNIPRCANG